MHVTRAVRATEGAYRIPECFPHITRDGEVADRAWRCIVFCCDSADKPRLSGMLFVVSDIVSSSAIRAYMAKKAEECMKMNGFF